MPKRILVVAQAWVGDLVLSQSLYKTLKRREPNVAIDVLAPPWAAELLGRMREVARALEMTPGHGSLDLPERRRLGRELRGVYDQAIVLQRSLKAALVPWFARIPLRTGFRGEMRYGLINDVRPFDREAMPRIVDRFVFLGQPRAASPSAGEKPAPELHVDKERAAIRAQELRLDLQKPVLALMPGAAFGRSKQWPPSRFAAVADRYAAAGWQAWLFGSSGDRPLAREVIRAASSPIADLCGRTSLADVVDLMSLTSFAVTNDSGLMHVAAAVGCPLVAVYGATSPDYTPPMTVPFASWILWRNLECSPCWKKTCRYGHYRCLTDISAQEVYTAARKVERDVTRLARVPRPRPMNAPRPSDRARDRAP